MKRFFRKTRFQSPLRLLKTENFQNFKFYRCWQLQSTFFKEKLTVTAEFYRHWHLHFFSKKSTVNVSACNSLAATMLKMYHNTNNWQKFRGGHLKSSGGVFLKSKIWFHSPSGANKNGEWLKTLHRQTFYKPLSRGKFFINQKSNIRLFQNKRSIAHLETEMLMIELCQTVRNSNKVSCIWNLASCFMSNANNCSNSWLYILLNETIKYFSTSFTMNSYRMQPNKPALH